MGPLLSRLPDIFSSLGMQRPARILMLGLDAAGKTTILFKVKFNEQIQTIPTIGFNVETVSPCRGVTFTVWDVGGAEGLIFVVDSNDRERISEAREELQNILESPYMSNIPVVIVANKQDLPNVMKPLEIIEKLGMNDLQGKHRWYLQPACAITGEGVTESMLEMSNLIKKYRKENK